jgi:hypothetical protein
MKNDGLPSIENSDAARQGAHNATPPLSTPVWSKYSCINSPAL